MRSGHDGTGTTRVTVAGELDIATAADFGIELARLIDDRGPNVLIDASALSFCDARGLAAITAADGLARRKGGAVTLTGVRPQLARILRAARLERLARARPAAHPAAHPWRPALGRPTADRSL
ncbi:STAS domain-containing protein [Actinomadura sp. B10D3]|uniref:STAS domain-containing protein n=1 Tax=Actinomadura sp. B10D3 TaxID=3153557 RepID=UPI00325E58D2